MWTQESIIVPKNSTQLFGTYSAKEFCWQLREQITLLLWYGSTYSTVFAMHDVEQYKVRYYGCRTFVFSSMTIEFIALTYKIRKYF